MLNTFVKAVNAFNSQNWNDCANCLDENVVAYNIGRFNYLTPKKAVMDYFRGVKDPEYFEPTNDLTLFPPVYPLSARGVALWTHQAAGHVKVPIKYEFQFNPGNFLLTSLWAQRSPPTTVSGEPRRSNRIIWFFAPASKAPRRCVRDDGGRN
jgi:hypothetical protein